MVADRAAKTISAGHWKPVREFLAEQLIRQGRKFQERVVQPARIE
jgi:hypothetical protein